MTFVYKYKWIITIIISQTFGDPAPRALFTSVTLLTITVYYLVLVYSSSSDMVQTGREQNCSDLAISLACTIPLVRRAFIHSIKWHFIEGQFPSLNVTHSFVHKYYGQYCKHFCSHHWLCLCCYPFFSCCGGIFSWSVPNIGLSISHKSNPFSLTAFCKHKNHAHME